MLLADREPKAAWQVTLDNVGWDAGEHRWMRLAEAREPSGPADALEIYLRLADAGHTVPAWPLSAFTPGGLDCCASKESQ